MTTVERPAATLEYVRVPITATPVGTNLAADAVALAFVAPGVEPATADWHTAAWDGTTAQLLVGPGATLQLSGTFDVYVKITDSPEIPVVQAGTITFV